MYEQLKELNLSTTLGREKKQSKAASVGMPRMLPLVTLTNYFSDHESVQSHSHGAPAGK